MAITATFKADFSSFSTAVQKAEAQLRSFETGASKVERSLARMTDGFSGRRVIQEATQMARVFSDMGDGAQLTQAELRRMGATANEAIAKMKALGIDVPPGIQRVADAAKGTTSAFDAMKAPLATVNGLLGAFGIGLSVSAVVGFGRALLDNADALTKMHDRTGISIQGLQRLQVAGDDAGNTIEEMSGAINQMQNRLAGGDASAVGALKTLGLSFDELRQMAPDQQFIAISDALRKVNDPAEQVSVAMDLFGKTGAQVLPTLKRGFDDLRDSAVGMSDETVARLEEMGDEMEATWRRIKNQSAEFFVSSVKQVEAGGNPYVRFFQQIRGEAKAVEEQLGKMTAAVQRSPLFNPPEQKDSQGLKSFILGDAAMREFERQMADAARLQREAASEAKQHADQLSRLRAEIEAINRANAATPVRGPEFSFTSGTLPDLDRIKAIVAAMESLNRGGRPLGIDPQSIEQAIAGGGAAGLEAIGARLPDLIQQNTTSGFAAAVATLPDLLQRALTGGGGLRGAFGAFGAQIGGSLGEGLFKAGGLLNGVGNKLAGLFGSSLGLALPGIGQVVGSLLGSALPKVWDGIKKLFGGPSQAELGGRDLERQFEASFGSFDNMVNTVGEWYRATGRTSEQAQRDVKALLDATRDGPAAVQAWIDKLNAVRDEAARLREADTATATAEAEAVAAKITAVIESLTKQRDDLLGQVANEAPEDVMGVIEAQTRGQIAALDAEIAKKQAELEAQAEDAAQKFEDTIANVDPETIHVPVVYDIPDFPDFPSYGAGIRIPDGAATGGRVTNTGIQMFGTGGVALPFRPRGTDTVPAMLTPGELILNAAQQKNVADQMRGNVADFQALRAEIAALRRLQEENNQYTQTQFPKDLARATRDDRLKWTGVRR